MGIRLARRAGGIPLWVMNDCTCIDLERAALAKEEKEGGTCRGEGLETLPCCIYSAGNHYVARHTIRRKRAM